MSEDNGQHADFHWQDAFTSPSWQIPDLDEAVLAPPLEDYGLTDFRAPRDLPTPPDVDEILRGEYTGWIPVIREGESLEQVQEREQARTTPPVSTQAPVSPSPWLAVETFDYGAQIEYETPIQAPVVQQPVVTPVTPAMTETPPPSTPVTEYFASEQIHAQPNQVEVETASPHNVQDAFDDTFDTSSWDSQPVRPEQGSSPTTQSIDATIVNDHSTATDHSLELVIMRDEIQDLRARLDASQKLVEEMMHKLAELAELALRSRM